MFKKIFFSFLLGFLFYTSFSQNKITINKSCSYYGEKNPTNVYTFSSDGEAQSILNMILSASGLSSNFKLVAGDVPNAAAVILLNPSTKEPERYIIYNQTFMYNIEKRINYWASVSILAHEIGHHLNGHSLMPGGSRPSIELEADKFSGFVLATLGANLEDAQAAINNLVSQEGSLTHPPKSARLAAIANGWYQSSNSRINNNNNNINNSIYESPSSTKIGQVFGGGVVIYIDNSTGHGLIVAQSDVQQKIKWQDAILKYSNFSMGGYDDWQLPTLQELNYIFKYKNTVGGFLKNKYWSSQKTTGKISSNQVWAVDFTNGDYAYWNDYFDEFSVRLVRHF